MIQLLGVDVLDDPDPHVWGVTYSLPATCDRCGQPVVTPLRVENDRCRRVVWVRHDRAYPDLPHSRCTAELLPHTAMDCLAMRSIPYPSDTLRAWVAEQETKRSVTG